jgi:hypothetical protein
MFISVLLLVAGVIGFRRVPAETVALSQATATRATISTDVGSVRLSEEKSKRIRMYVDSYKYQTPDPTQPALSENVSCGSSPAFEDYVKKRHHRYKSQFYEDMWLWKNFFHNFKELSNPPSKITSSKHRRRQPAPTFVELGAYNGMQWSNTIFLEACLGWTNGLMIEASPSVFPALVSNRPRTHRLSFAPTCQTRSDLSFGASGRPGTSVVQDHGSGSNATTTSEATVTVPCGPLGPVLENLLDGYVTLFSLDVEGSESAVLETIDFSRVRVDIWMVEAERPGEDQDSITKAADRVVEILTSNGYRLYRGLMKNSNLFVHKDSMYQLDAVKFKISQ